MRCATCNRRPVARTLAITGIGICDPCFCAVIEKRVRTHTRPGAVTLTQYEGYAQVYGSIMEGIHPAEDAGCALLVPQEEIALWLIDHLAGRDSLMRKIKEEGMHLPFVKVSAAEIEAYAMIKGIDVARYVPAGPAAEVLEDLRRTHKDAYSALAQSCLKLLEQDKSL